MIQRRDRSKNPGQLNLFTFILSDIKFPYILVSDLTGFSEPEKAQIPLYVNNSSLSGPKVQKRVSYSGSLELTMGWGREKEDYKSGLLLQKKDLGFPDPIQQKNTLLSITDFIKVI